MSSVLCFVSNTLSLWLTNSDDTTPAMMRSTAPIQRPSDSPLLSTRVPLEVRARLQASVGGARGPASGRSVLVPQTVTVLFDLTGPTTTR
jgi:hypothetical protein